MENILKILYTGQIVCLLLVMYNLIRLVMLEREGGRLEASHVASEFKLMELAQEK